MKTNRYYSTNRIGSFVTPDYYASSEEAIRRLSLPPSNAATRMCEVVIPKGVRVQASDVGEAFGQPGGGKQLQIMERLPSESFGPGRLVRGSALPRLPGILGPLGILAEFARIASYVYSGRDPLSAYPSYQDVFGDPNYVY